MKNTASSDAMNGSVLHIIKVTGVAGAENHLLALLPGLRTRGVPVSLLLLTEPGNPMEGYVSQMIAAGVPTRRLTIRLDLDPTLIVRLIRLFQQERPQAVHTHLIHADWHGIFSAKQAGVKAIFTTGHNDDPFRRRAPIQLIQRWLWKRVTRGIAISDAVRRFQIKIEGAPADRVTTVHYGLDPAVIGGGEGSRAMLRHELGISPQATVFGSVCRLIPQKGIDDALRAFWQVTQQLPDAHYVLIGDGPERATLEAQAAQYRLAHRIHFLGWRDNARTLMSTFDLFVMPSRWEGFGLVTLEAMAASLPVIATSVSALPEIVVPKVTGMLVPPGDVQALAEAMLIVGSQTDTIQIMGSAGRKRLETEFSVDQMINRTMDVYRSGGLQFA